MANFYDIPLQESELLNRPNQTFTVKGQAGLLATALALDVPVLSSDTNTLVGFTSFQAGTGASFAVSRAEHELVPLIRDKLVNTSSEVQDRWKRTLFQGSRNERFVVKRIVPSKDSANPSDAPRLAPLVNEIRILSNQRLKQCPFIVPLIALSWYESQVNGRFWPQLLLEAADEGTLTEYLASSEISFNTQLALSQEIAQGLKYLHDQGIVHCDLKPGNMLVYSKNVSSERLEMCINAGIEPVEVKICDFGFAVILSDYEAGRRFQARIGTVPWMAPELDMAEPVALDLLHKADIYSFGLVVASILMRGVRPFQGLLAGEITELKGQTIGSSDSVVTTLLGNIQEKITLNEHQEEFIEAFLSGVCEPEPEDRVCLAAVQRYLFMGMLQCLADGEPLIPTAFFPDLDDAYPGYFNALRHLNRRCSPPHGQSDQDMDHQSEQISSLQAQLYERHMALSFARTGFRENPVADIFPEHISNAIALPDSTESKDESNWEAALGEGAPDEASSTSILASLDLAYEHNFNSALLPSVVQREVLADLRRQADSDPEPHSAASSEAAFQLAGAYLNGQIVELDQELAFKYLERAVKLGSAKASAVAIDLYEACGRQIPGAIEKRVRAIVGRYGEACLEKAQWVSFKLSQTESDNSRSRSNETCARTWSRLWPDRYSAWLNTRLGNAVCRTSMNLKITRERRELFIPAGPGVSKRSLDFPRMKSLGIDGQGRFIVQDKEHFRHEVQQHECLNDVNKSGFTLLQEAVIQNDLELVTLLVCELGALVDECGNTSGWTPLLLACYCGYFDLAEFLMAQGADASLCEAKDGISLLHLLNRFTVPADCRRILQRALAAGVDVNAGLSNGLTPLHATFLSWDYSNGYAAQLLLEQGADPTREAKIITGMPGEFDNLTSLGPCAERLDANLLEKLFDATPRHWSVGGVLRDAATKMFLSLAQTPRFRHMSIVGSGWETRLADVLRLIVDRNLMTDLQTIVIDMQPFDIIGLAAQFGRGHFVEALLKILPDDTVNLMLSSAGPSRSAIHRAIERRSLDAVCVLIKYGADLLALNSNSQTALHCAAQYYPSILPELIEIAEALPLEERQNQSIKQILDKVDENELTVFGLLLTEGYEDKQRLAETLRAKYGLLYNFAFRRPDDSCMSLVGHLVTMVVGSGMIPASRVQYLLRLDPPPEFVCTSAGETLLTLAVKGPFSHCDDHDTPNNLLVPMILQTYPASVNILLGKPYSALHMAALYANRVALETFIEHIEEHDPDKPMPLNYRVANGNGNTVLDCAGTAVAHPLPQREDPDGLDQIASREQARVAVRCYELLRGKGALHNWELKGCLLAARLVCWRLDWNQLVDAMKELTVELGLGPLQFDVDDVVDITPSDSDLDETQTRRLPIVELVWRFDNFILRVYRVRVTGIVTDAAEEFTNHVRQTRPKEDIQHYIRLGLEPGSYPFRVMTYTATVPNTEINATWTRTGRVWTVDETIELRARFSRAWDRRFGEAEEEVLRSNVEESDAPGRENDASGQVAGEEAIINNNGSGIVERRTGSRCLVM